MHNSFVLCYSVGTLGVMNDPGCEKEADAVDVAASFSHVRGRNLTCSYGSGRPDNASL